ncbi:hypothetical protein G8T71_06885 [Clostridium botulinum C/D]|nr:hypothetical protein [Clostridium botulinum]MCD3211079.1 hypothetical protein [Clostridium botulinum C/D]
MSEHVKRWLDMKAELITPYEAIHTLEHRFCLKDAKKFITSGEKNI